MKIINQKKKTDWQTRKLHFSKRFSTIQEIKEHLMEEFGQQVPPLSAKFDIGYYAGRQSSKLWLCTNDDVHAMYTAHDRIGSEILLWCDARVTINEDSQAENHQPTQKDSEPLGKRANQSEKAQSIVTELQKLHRDKYTMIQYRLWARMIVSGIHTTTEEPPDVPAITGTNKKKHSGKKSTNVNPMKVTTESDVCDNQTAPHSPSLARQANSIGISPGRVVDIRCKYLDQLGSIKKLFEDRVLNEDEFLEQKRIILSSLSDLSPVTNCN